MCCATVLNSKWSWVCQMLNNSKRSLLTFLIKQGGIVRKGQLGLVMILSLATASARVCVEEAGKSVRKAL